MSRILKAAIIQRRLDADREPNLRGIAGELEKAARLGAELVVLPELHCGPYFCQTEDPRNFDLAEEIPGPTTRALGELASRHGLVIVSSLFERRAPGLCHNTAVVLESDGSIAGTYRKMHIPDDPGFYEKFYFTPGDLGFRPVTTRLGKIGVLVCWDQWFPEAARLQALAGAELLVYPTAIGFDPADDPAEQQRQLDAWVTVQRGHAVANGLPVIAVNRTGLEPDPTGEGAGIRFWGNSFAAGPQGEVLLRMDDNPDTQAVSLDMARSESVRRLWPFLRDRRVDAYADLTRVYRD